MTYGAGLDARILANFYIGLEATNRDQDEPLFSSPDEVLLYDRDEEIYRAYLYWTPGREWAVRAEVQLDVFERERAGRGPTQVETTSLPVSVGYFHPSGVVAGLGIIYAYQRVREPLKT